MKRMKGNQKLKFKISAHATSARTLARQKTFTSGI